MSSKEGAVVVPSVLQLLRTSVGVNSRCGCCFFLQQLLLRHGEEEPYVRGFAKKIFAALIGCLKDRSAAVRAAALDSLALAAKACSEEDLNQVRQCALRWQTRPAPWMDEGLAVLCLFSADRRAKAPRSFRDGRRGGLCRRSARRGAAGSGKNSFASREVKTAAGGVAAAPGVVGVAERLAGTFVVVSAADASESA